MDTWQILCTLRYLNSFLCLPLRFITIVTTSPETLHTHCQCQSPYRGRFALASHTSYTDSSSAYYFVSYDILPLVASIIAFKRYNCTTWDYNKRQLQGLTSDGCG